MISMEDTDKIISELRTENEELKVEIELIKKTEKLMREFLQLENKMLEDQLENLYHEIKSLRALYE